MERKPLLLEKEHMLSADADTTIEVLSRLIATVKYYGYCYLTPEQRNFDKEGYGPYSFLSQMDAMCEFEKRLRTFSLDRLVEVQNQVYTVEECQQVILADNFKQAQEVFEQGVEESVGISPPFESINKWCMRKAHNLFVKRDFDADGLLIDEIVGSIPYPQFWISTPRQMFNYIIKYNLALQRAYNKGKISFPFYKRIVMKMRDLKSIKNFEVRLKQIKEIRQEVILEMGPGIRREMSVIVTRMNSIMRRYSVLVLRAQFPGYDFNYGGEDRLSNIILDDPPPSALYRYETGRCAANYFLYYILYGYKGKTLQSRVARDIYDIFDIDFIELFASPLNKVKERWCSLFPYDQFFGSMGNAFAIPCNQKYLAYPPPLEDYVLYTLTYFKDAECFFLFLPSSSLFKQLVRDKNLSFCVIPKSRFKYEQLLSKCRSPGVVDDFYRVEDTIIIWWGFNYILLNFYLNKLLVYFDITRDHCYFSDQR